MSNTPEPHVLFITYHLPTDEEPGAMRPWVEARLLRDAGYRVTVVTSAVHYMTGQFAGPGRGWCREEWRDDIRILRVWTITDYRRSVLRRIANYTIFGFNALMAALVKVRERVDCILSGTDPVFANPFVYLIHMIKRARLVLDERDLFPQTAVAMNVLREGAVVRATAAAQQAFRRRADAMIAATPGIRRELVALGHAAEGVHVFPNADPYLELARDSVLSLQAQRFFLRYPRCIGYAGTLGICEDIETIIRAVAELRDLLDVGLVLAGGGERLFAHRRLAQELGLHNVVFLGPLPREQARAVLSCCKIGVEAYPPGEFFRNTLASKIFDYIGLGLPVVFAGEGDTAEVLKAAGAGIAVPCANGVAMAAALRELLTSEGRRRKMRERGLAWYAQEISVTSMRRILQTVCG